MDNTHILNYWFFEGGYNFRNFVHRGLPGVEKDVDAAVQDIAWGEQAVIVVYVFLNVSTSSGKSRMMNVFFSLFSGCYKLNFTEGILLMRHLIMLFSF